MYRFTQRSLPVDLPSLDLRIVDLLGLTEEMQAEICQEFDTVFGALFLAGAFPEKKLCRTMDHLKDLYNAYVDFDVTERAAGRVPATMEEWSRENGAQHVNDEVSLPHEGVRWFELRSIATGRRVGAMQISRIDLMNTRGKRLELCGHPIMTLPAHPTLSYPEFWGEVLRELLDERFVNPDTPSESFAFEEWKFPTTEAARYVDRPGNSFGKDIIDRASVGRRIERGAGNIDRAPLNLRKRARGQSNIRAQRKA